MERQNDGQMSIRPHVPQHCKQTTGAPVTQAASAGLLAGAVLEGTWVEGREPVMSRSVYTNAHPEENYKTMMKHNKGSADTPNLSVAFLLHMIAPQGSA